MGNLCQRIRYLLHASYGAAWVGKVSFITGTDKHL